MNKEEKKEEIKNISGNLVKSQIALCADFTGISVLKMTALRKDLRSAGSIVKVIKNSLAKISIDDVFVKKSFQNVIQSKVVETEVEKFSKLFIGPTVLIYSHIDPISPTKILAKFKKENDFFKIKGALVDGSFIDSSGVDTLSNMPGKDELLSQLLRLIMTPATNIVRFINEPSSLVVRAIDSYRAKLEEK